MPQWMLWTVLGIGLAAFCLTAFLVLRGLVSPLRPLTIFLTAWRCAIECVWKTPRAFLAIAAVIGTGAALQLYFTATHAVSDDLLMVASIGWQAAMATLIAALAVYVHLYVIHEILAARRFGAETPFYRGASVNEALHPRSAPIKLLAQAAIVGLLIWGLGYALNLGARAAAEATPGAMGYAALYGAMFAGFLIVTLFSLIRPALSLSARQPLATGLAQAFSHALPLYVLTGLLVIAPAVLGYASVYVPAQFFPENTVARAGGAGFFLVFTVFQTVAVEIATVLFLNRAMNRDT